MRIHLFTSPAIEASPRTAALLFACYVVFYLAAGGSLRSHLWNLGQHATPQQWGLHQRLEARGQEQHHARHPDHPGHAARDWVNDLLRAEAAVSESTAATAAAGGLFCALCPIASLPARSWTLLRRRLTGPLVPTSLPAAPPFLPPRVLLMPR